MRGLARMGNMVARAAGALEWSRRRRAGVVPPPARWDRPAGGERHGVRDLRVIGPATAREMVLRRWSGWVLQP